MKKHLKMKRTNPVAHEMRGKMTFVAHLLPLLRAALVVVTALAAQPSHAHMKGMYETKAEAEARAAQLKCKGAFKMGDDWMPCANERALHDALQR